MNQGGSIAVFLGPSLPFNQARQILSADYYPPARKGDIYRLIASGIEAIILIDGLFHSTPSVWQRELVNAIEDGIQVFGAASMGALRAAELEPFGMVGCGTIFEWYRDGEINGDDEVALLHGPQAQDFIPLSEPLVNIRYTLRKAVEDHIITSEQAQALIDDAKHLYYPQRSYRQLLKSPLIQDLAAEDAARLEHYLLIHRVDLKQRDAIKVLERYAALQSTPHPQPCQHYRFAPPTINRQLARLTMMGFVTDHGIVTGKTVLQALKQKIELQTTLRPILSKHCFLLTWARQNHISYPPEQLTAYMEQWQQRYGIVDLVQWLQANGLTPLTYRERLAEHCLIDWITAQGPHTFGIDWPDQIALEPALCLTGRANQRSDRAQNTHLQSSEAVSSDSAQGWDNEQMHGWRQWSQRGFILDWIRQNGVACPSSYLRDYIKTWEAENGVLDRAEWLQTHGLTVASDRAWLTQQVQEAWVIKQGPSYFGINWSFDVALLEHMQITGKAAQLLATRNSSTC